MTVLVSLLYRKHKTADYQQAYGSAFVSDIPTPRAGVPLVEEALGRLLGKGLVSDTGSGLTISEGLWPAADAAASARGGWLEWFRRGDFDNAPTDVDGEGDRDRDPEQWDEEYDTRADLIREAYALAPGEPVAFAFPPEFAAPRTKLIDDTGPGLAAVAGGVAAAIAAPLLVIAGLGWTGFSSIRFAFRRGSGRI